ncbi:GNAT family N-acetyltransferase [Streptomyces pseudovenezuelae]|nr:GNAT family N-acetyltransferase [Streptomyces pseudovenezuelae]
MRPDDWYPTDDLDVFLSHAGDFLRSRPDLHTLDLTATDGLRTGGPRVHGPDAPYFGALERDGTVRAACFQTPPYGLRVTPVTAEEADSLAVHLVGLGRPVPGVGAERDSAAAFAEAWQRYTGATAVLHDRHQLYRLGTLTAPEPLPEGRPRVAGERDRELLARWYGEFTEAVSQPGGEGGGSWADGRLAYGGVTLWEAPDGTPVAMAGRTPLVAGQIRVAHVYTPAHLRGRGYAGAVTAEISRTAREGGADEVLLFTDLANPTSNALYQRIGYRPVADFAIYDFTDADAMA